MFEVERMAVGLSRIEAECQKEAETKRSQRAENKWMAEHLFGAAWAGYDSAVAFLANGAIILL